ncbi:MAG: ADP-ribosylglycohydrolase family protein, partial [Chloroflexota bacterium]
MKAWQIERELRDNAVPLDRRINQSNWYDSSFEFPSGDALIKLFWDSHVPGSGAPEIPYLEMAQAAYTKGRNTSKAAGLIIKGLELYKQGQIDDLRALTAEIIFEINQAPVDPGHPYNHFQHPETWLEIKAAFGKIRELKIPFDQSNIENRILNGWLGQLAGGSFGTAIEGYIGEKIAGVYGDIRSYITPPETTNDDVVYELVLLDVFERMGRKITSRELAMEWLKQIPFGWSAEWIALRNLNQGIFPPESGSFNNPYSNWIGAQMRGMICGMLAPGWPMEAARLAHIDGIISHDNNGVYGEIFAAVLTSLAFVHTDPRTILLEAAEYIPQKSLYASVVRNCLDVVSKNTDPAPAWKILEKTYEEYNWIDAHNNIAAVILSLWYCQNDMTECFSLLAKAGLDVDCNGGLAGNVLGIIQPVPLQWAEPLGDLLETYLKGKEKISIKELSARTSRLAKLNLK